MNCCKPEQVGTKEYGKMLKRIQVLEGGRIPAREARNWKSEGQKRRITRKEHRRLWNEFEVGGFIAQKGLWNLARESAAALFEKKETLSERTRPCMNRIS